MKKLTTLLLLAPLGLFAQDMNEPPTQGISQMLILFAMAMFFFYFILWRPEQKRRKAMDKMRAEMKKGDRVNAMGILGTIDRINDHTVILKMVDGSKIEVIKPAISEVTPSTGEEAKS
ncbi:MAG: preprotein translocase subunit YajC [Parachlamydiaceae bacterium]